RHTATAAPDLDTLSLHDALPIWSGRWLAPVCCACGARRRRESAASAADSAPPCVRRDGPACGPVACPSPARCRHASGGRDRALTDRKSTRLNSSHVSISYAVFCL